MNNNKNDYDYDLNVLRGEIDEIDDNITELLLKRFDIVLKVAEYKKANITEILQKDRETEIFNNIDKKIDKSGKSGDYKKYIRNIYQSILDASKQSQIK